MKSECRAHMASVKPRHPDVLKELHRIHRLMHAGKPYAFEQSLLCELIHEIERLLVVSNRGVSAMSEVRNNVSDFLTSVEKAAFDKGWTQGLAYSIQVLANTYQEDSAAELLMQSGLTYNDFDNVDPYDRKAVRRIFRTDPRLREKYEARKRGAK